MWGGGGWSGGKGVNAYKLPGKGPIGDKYNEDINAFLNVPVVIYKM